MKNNKEPTVRVKILVAGDSRAGKSTLISQYKKNYFSAAGIENKYSSTDAVTLENIFTQKVELQCEEWQQGSGPVDQGCFDFFGDQRAHLILFDVTDRNSFPNKISNQLSILDVSYVPKIIVGTKIDLEKERKITYDEARKYADSCDIPYIEVSATKNINVNALFRFAAYRCEKSVKEFLGVNTAPDTSRHIINRNLHEYNAKSRILSTENPNRVKAESDLQREIEKIFAYDRVIALLNSESEHDNICGELLHILRLSIFKTDLAHKEDSFFSAITTSGFSAALVKSIEQIEKIYFFPLGSHRKIIEDRKFPPEITALGILEINQNLLSVGLKIADLLLLLSQWLRNDTVRILPKDLMSNIIVLTCANEHGYTTQFCKKLIEQFFKDDTGKTVAPDMIRPSTYTRNHFILSRIVRVEEEIRSPAFEQKK